MMKIPIIPNSPLSQASDAEIFGYLSLKKNVNLDFIENSAFDTSIISYNENYHNSQGHSGVFKNHLHNVIKALDGYFKPQSKLVEVGCGKGEFLEILKQTDRYTVRGYDVSYEGDLDYIEARYLTENDRIEADGIILRHVLEHISQPHLFLALLHRVFGSVPIYIEVPRSEWIFENQAFFDITYEHVNYFSERSLSALFDQKQHCQERIFGDQYQYIIANLGDLSTNFITAYSNGADWRDLDFDLIFPQILVKIDQIESSLHSLGNVYLWGGATKGCMFLHHCIRLNRLSGRFKMVVDINPVKWGKFMPSSLIPINSAKRLYEQIKPHDTIIVANPNYFLEVSTELRKNGFGDVNVVAL